MTEHSSLAHTSNTGEGLHTTGIVGFAFLPFDKFAGKEVTEKVHKMIQDRIASLDPETAPPGLLDQYNLMLERYTPGSGSPGCEFISFPGFLSGPSAYLSMSYQVPV